MSTDYQCENRLHFSLNLLRYPFLPKYKTTEVEVFLQLLKKCIIYCRKILHRKKIKKNRLLKL